jgi:class 3 adenylate cyclase
MTASSTFIQRLRHAGIEPGDTEDLKIRKTVMIFAMGLMTAAPMFWLALYWMMNLQLSATLPLAYQLVSVSTLLVYVWTRNFSFFCVAQLTLFLFFPVAAQLSIGNFIAASGVVLWSVLAPVVAVMTLGGRQSIPWFIAYIAMLGMCGYIDFELGATQTRPTVPTQTSALFFMLNFAAVSSLVYFLLRYSAMEKQRYRDQLENAHSLLKIEQEKSERLLLNILPEPVAMRLKQNDTTIADGFADVTVMFADIVNFTSLAEGMSPNQIFTMLNRVFSTFDGLAEKHGLEKIKTIGDAYMVAGGLNTDDSSLNYTEAIADMALDMREVLATDLTVNGTHLEIRIGIGTGPIVGGVVGKKKFIYDLWGDTVNLASRITTEGVPGMIQVDTMSWRRLRQCYDFHEPQTLYLKGKGETIVYRLMGRKAVTTPRGVAS